MQECEILNLNTLRMHKIYFRKDIKTTNPRKLARYIFNALIERDYLIYKSNTSRCNNPKDCVKIEKDPVGDIGFIDLNIIGVKSTKIERPYTKTHPAAIILGILGFLLLSSGFISLLFGAPLNVFLLILVLSAVILAGAIYLALKIKVVEKEEIPGEIKICIRGIGEACRAKQLESLGSKNIEQEQIFAEMSLHFAGDVKREELYNILEKDLSYVLDKIKTIAEYESQNS